MKIGLVLGGGGARGAAHIGVLIELLRLGIEPDLITGTSIGGLVGALKAADVDLEAIVEFFPKLNANNVYALPGHAPSVTGHAKLQKMLEKVMVPRTFAELKIPLALMATDLTSRKSVVLDEGDLISAVLATVSIPLLFPPVERDGRFLVDGGMLNNTPFDVAAARGASFVIAVDLSETAPYGTPSEPDPAPQDVLHRLLNATRLTEIYHLISTVTDIVTVNAMNVRLAISRPEILLRPNMGNIGIFDFHRWKDGIEAGRAAVRAAQDQFETLSRQIKACQS